MTESDKISSLKTEFPGDDSYLEPPDPIPNSEVKQMRADDSVGFPHVKVGHRQVFIFTCNLNQRTFIPSKARELQKALVPYPDKYVIPI